MLISVDTYRAITGDNATAATAVTEAVDNAQRSFEERIGRPLEQAQRTERCRVFPDGRVYPRATPIVAAQAGATIYGASISDGHVPGSFINPDTHAQVTYTGGYDPAETDLAAVDYVPVELRRAIAWAAHSLLHATVSAAPAGAVSVSVGDVSVNYGPGGAPAAGELVFDAALVRRYRWRREMAA